MALTRLVNWLNQNWFKIILSMSLLMISVGFILYLNDRAKLAREAEAYRRAQARQVREDRIEQEKREFSLKRRSSCLDIYKTESSKWNNVRGWDYDEMKDVCFIRYKDNSPKSSSVCDKRFNADFLIHELLACYDGEFVARF